VATSAGYSGTPLPKKLGIKPDSTLALVGAPEDFEETLGPLDEVTVRRSARGRWDLLLLFVTRRADLARKLPGVVEKLDGRSFWIAWPKRSSGVPTDVTEDTLRELALPLGVVDYKVCAIDATWSGLKFARRAKRDERRGAN
jgi:hypothetical protein